ncbi:MAG: elongation factor P maturation arginine rhamnosyltransferase EarP [Methylotenera sp.]
MSNNKSNRWDIFYRIVDNYGDIGVCWRLSQQLAHEHHLQVRLFIDDYSTASKIISQLDITLQQQSVSGVEICAWPKLENKSEFNTEIKPADVVVETFSCGLPDIYIQHMQPNKTIWINLEYLSAEAWVSDFHAKPSPHPTLPLTKHYFFPGFFNDTGGLIRKSNLIAQRDEFLNSKAMLREFWQKLGILKPEIFQSESEDSILNSVKISLFHYPQANINSLFSALEKADQPIRLFLPFNGDIATLNDNLTDFKLKVGEVLHKGNLTVHLVPFLSQADYDHLLWACDLNFVRGEDSWIRAVWAGKPFIWQPYIQTDDTHIKKLNAFLEAYSSDASSDVKSLLRESNLAWSNSPNISNDEAISSNNFTQDESSQSELWQSLINHLPALHAYAVQQSNALATQPDLATKLVIFSENLRKK